MTDDTAKPTPACPRCSTVGTKAPPGLLEWEVWCPMCGMSYAVCPACGLPYTAPMSPYCRDNHEAPLEYHPFIPYFDFALGAQVDSLRQRHKLMREAHVDYRDKPSVGELSKRADKANERRREEARDRPRGRIYSR